MHGGHLIQNGRKAGFTLMEAVISSMILSLAIATSLAIMSHSSNYINDIRLRSRSTQILQQKVEDLRLLNWSNVLATATTFTDPADTNNTYAGTVTMSTYQTYGGTATVKLVTVQATWTNSHRRVVTNSVATLISNNGLNGLIP
jgi:Tfp pilus assembly protein PilE